MTPEDTNETVKPVLGMEPEVHKGRKITVADLTIALNNASEVMGNTNPHKVLVLNAASALQQLVKQLDMVHRQRALLIEEVEELREENERLKKDSGGFVVSD